MAPDLTAVAAVIEAASQREVAVRDSVGLSIISNAVGAVLGFRGVLGLEEAARTGYITALAAIADGWLRLRGGKRSGSTLAHPVDPHPEQ